MNKLSKIVVAIGLSASLSLSVMAEAENQCQYVAELAGMVAKYRTEGMTKRQQYEVADAALARGVDRSVMKLHKQMIDSCYENNLDEEEMKVIYYLACRKAGKE